MEEGTMSTVFSGICCYVSAYTAANQGVQAGIKREIASSKIDSKKVKTGGGNRAILVNAFNCANTLKYCLLAGEPEDIN